MIADQTIEMNNQIVYEVIECQKRSDMDYMSFCLQYLINAENVTREDISQIFSLQKHLVKYRIYAEVYCGVYARGYSRLNAEIARGLLQQQMRTLMGVVLHYLLDAAVGIIIMFWAEY